MAQIKFTFHHVVLWVADMERSLRFYRELLGFVPDRKHEPKGEAIDTILGKKNARIITAYGTIGGVGLEFVQMIDPPYDELHQRTGEPLPWRQGPETIAFDVEDMDAFLAHAKRIGAPLTCPPVTFATGQRNAFVHDPDGIRLEVIQRTANSLDR